MKKNVYISVKALLLVMVFSMNTISGFACSLGLKIGYNNQHHQEKTTPSSFPHQHQHEEDLQHHSPSPQGSNDCCSNEVTSFTQMDKIPATGVTLVHPLSTPAHCTSIVLNEIFPKHFILKDIRAFAQPYHPPIPDIRIAIQSFLI